MSKDTTTQMQDLNEAYYVLADLKNRFEYDFKFNAYFFDKTKHRVDDNSIYEEASMSNQSLSFLSIQKETSFKIDAWVVKYNLHHLFIYHPKIHGCKDNITFWNLSNNPSVSMPINFDQKLHQQLRKTLIPIIPLCSYWPCDNDVEIMIKLPKDQDSLNSLLDSISEIYTLPAQLIDFVKEKMGLSLNVTFTV